MFKAVLFDMDGLMTDTETLGIRVAVKVCQELNIVLNIHEQKSFIGITDNKFYEQLFLARRLDTDVETVLKRHFSIYDELLKTELIVFPGARHIPYPLKKLLGLKLAVVSGSTLKQIKIILSQLNTLKLFDIIVSCKDTPIGKPNPAGYILAAQRLSVNPEECVVLEDATTGVVAGKKAGMKVIGVVNNGSQDLSWADVIVQDLWEAFDVLIQMC